MDSKTYHASLYNKTSVPPPEQNISLTNVIGIFTAIPNVHHRHYINLPPTSEYCVQKTICDPVVDIMVSTRICVEPKMTCIQFGDWV
jgi:hypothetical protein